MNFRILWSNFLKNYWTCQREHENQETNFRIAIAIEKHVIVALWHLSTVNSFRTTRKMLFVIGKWTAAKIACEFRDVISNLAQNYIKFPKTRRDTAEAIHKFKNDYNCKIPEVVATIIATHIHIICPSDNSKVDYFSRKQKYAVNAQRELVANWIFLDVTTGFPGNIHDSLVLRNTTLF